MSFGFSTVIWMVFQFTLDILFYFLGHENFPVDFFCSLWFCAYNFGTAKRCQKLPNSFEIF